MFTLPAVQAAAVSVSNIDDGPILPGSQVVPYLTVLPMGWSWALHLCQNVLDGAIRDTGFKDDAIISDRGVPSTLMVVWSHVLQLVMRIILLSSDAAALR